MREIKFRTWDGWKMNYEPPISMYSTTSINEWFEDGNIMQFTGLKDKNRKDIYEGDVVKFDADYIKPMVVYWNNEMTGFYPLISERPNRITVIGNIYENPELIK
jgi:hypothetical protein